MPQRRGLLFVLSSPSGAGKTTISRALLDRDARLTMSVSVTTRPRRQGEAEGIDYHFIDDARFEAMRDAGALLEYADVFGKRYGTPREPVERTLAGGHDVLFDIDWQGTQQLREKLREDLVSVFILPPSAQALESRLRARGRDPESVIASRMAKAADEMEHYPEYDYVIVNDDLERSITTAYAILEAERARRTRYAGLNEFVTGQQRQLRAQHGDGQAARSR